MTETQRLDEIRGFLKNLNTWDEPLLFEPAVITEHPDYTVVVAPAPAEADIEPPTVYCIENSELLKLSRYLDQYERGDEVFDNFKGYCPVFVENDPTRENMFWDLLFTLTAWQTGYILDLRVQPLGDYVLSQM